MARTTPRVVEGQLCDPATGAQISLNAPAWYAWLDATEHQSFHFHHPAGSFTARKERKQRGQWYWVAYRQANYKLYKRYLGKSACLTHAHLCATAESLSQVVAEARR